VGDCRIKSADRYPRTALRDLLAKPLRFGDPDQIEAVFILRIAEELVGAPRECVDCDGEGVIEAWEVDRECPHCGRECSYCSDDAEDEKCRTCKGEGMGTWTREEVYSLRPDRILELLGADLERVA
jgi:hypothetical protein